jgi:NADH-quinone oxidoreductase subunit E
MKSTVLKEISLEDILKIIQTQKKIAGGLIAILEAIQKQFRYLPQKAIELVARETGHSMVDVYSVATFYRAFSLKPRGKHLVSVCLGTACHVRGGPAVVSEMEKQLKIRVGETTADNEFTLETVNCLGACALGPIVVIDGRFFANVKTAEVKQILKKARKSAEAVDAKHGEQLFPIRVNCPHCNHSLMDPHSPIDGCPSINVTASFERKHGYFRLSGLYGSNNIESEHEIPLDTLIHFFCPHCHSELISGSNCLECGAPMFPMIVQGGGMIQECSRRGCPSHRLDLDGVNF